MASSAKYGTVTVEREPGNPLNGTDEPVFIIRARDKLAVEAILDYRDEYEREVHGGKISDGDAVVQALRQEGRALRAVAGAERRSRQGA